MYSDTTPFSIPWVCIDTWMSRNSCHDRLLATDGRDTMPRITADPKPMTPASWVSVIKLFIFATDAAAAK